MLMIGQRKEGDSRAGCLYGEEISADSGKEHSAPGTGTAACLQNEYASRKGRWGHGRSVGQNPLSVESAGEAIGATPLKLQPEPCWSLQRSPVQNLFPPVLLRRLGFGCTA